MVGVNIGKTRVVPEGEAAADYAASARLLAGVADYLVVNVSSPNTPGLRNLQATEHLRSLFTAVREVLDAASTKRVPLLVKIAPDLADEEIDAIADLALELGVDGIVATNTTTSRDHLASDPAQVAAIGAGGLSGAPLGERALQVLSRLHARTSGRVVLVAVGGIETADDAWERITAGATLVQGYTGFVYGGPLWPHRHQLRAGPPRPGRGPDLNPASRRHEPRPGTRARQQRVNGHGQPCCRRRLWTLAVAGQRRYGPWPWTATT